MLLRLWQLPRCGGDEPSKLTELRRSMLWTVLLRLLAPCCRTECAALIFVLLLDSPLTAKFLNGRERVVVIERLRHNQMGIETKVWMETGFGVCAAYQVISVVSAHVLLIYSSRSDHFWLSHHKGVWV